MKRDITAAFSAATATYDSAATAQGISAARLAELVCGQNLAPGPKVLEIGCGTGLLTRALLPKLGGDWLVTDLSPAMVEAARALGLPARFQVMDGEAPEGDGYDLVVSNLAAQWFGDLGAAAARLAATLKRGGLLAFSTLGAGSFIQWRDAHDSLGLACGLHAYPDADALRAMLPRAARVLSEPIQVDYADGLAFLRALKAVGAGTPAPFHRPLSPGQLRRVLAALGAPARITYHLLYVLWVAE